MVIERASDSRTATDRLCERARKNWPGTPDRSPSGAKTTTVVSVELTSGPKSSETASVTLATPSPAFRWMFSTTTTASSMTRPMATASPPIDIRLIDPPNTCMNTNVGITAIGRVMAAMAVRRASRRKIMSTTTARSPPMRMASRTLSIAERTNSARS